jgi:hypothetical protein
MIALGVLCLIIGGGDTTLTADTIVLHKPAADTVATALTSPSSLADTIRPRRRRSVEVSEWYGRRLTIHRYVAYATIPVFAMQYAAGNQLYTKGSQAPGWAKTTHRFGATTLAGMFTVNTVTGAWNWWESRSAPNGRMLRTLHALTILGADAAFTYAGVKLSEDAENSTSARTKHRNIALTSIGVTAVSGIAMKFLNK